MPQDTQDRARGSAELPRLIIATYAPHRMEVRHHARRDEHGARTCELAVIDISTADEIVFEVPGVRGLRVFLNVPRHDRVAPAADSDVERRPRSTRVRHARGKAHPLDDRSASNGVSTCRAPSRCHRSSRESSASAEICNRMRSVAYHTEQSESSPVSFRLARNGRCTKWQLVRPCAP